MLVGRKIPYQYREVSPRVHSGDFWDGQIDVFLDILARTGTFTTIVARRDEKAARASSDATRRAKVGERLAAPASNRRLTSDPISPAESFDSPSPADESELAQA
jgi:hypothetical protein